MNYKKQFIDTLMKLDGILQMLGVRQDWGYSDHPCFCLETLAVAAKYNASRTDDPKGMLLELAYRLVNMATQRQPDEDEQNLDKHLQCISGADVVSESNQCRLAFNGLIEQYKKSRREIRAKQ